MGHRSHQTESRAQYLVAQLGGRFNIVRTPMMGTRIICLGSGGGGGSVWTVQTHLGQAYGVSIERLRWLWRAPNSTTYTCTMYGVATTIVRPDIARLDIDPRTTIVTATPVSRGSTQWFMSSDSCVGAVPDPEVPQCAVARRSTTALQRDVRVAVVVNHVSGNPVTVEGLAYSNAMVLFNR